MLKKLIVGCVTAAVVLTGVLAGGVAQAAPSELANIPDLNLKACINEALEQSPGEDVTEAQLATLTTLQCYDKGIESLSGPENAVGLTSIMLTSNLITDLTPISGIAGLGYLSLADNKLSDISAIAQLTNLREVNLSANDISDVRPLANLTLVKELRLNSNEISDAAPLAAMPNLTYLDLGFNDFSSAESFVALKTLTHLGLDSNEITDLAPLSELTGLVELDVSSNAVTTAVPLLALTNLEYLSVGDNQLTELPELSSLEKLTYLGIYANELTDLAPVTALTGLKNLSASNNVGAFDLAPLSELKDLVTLQLGSDGVSDLSPLVGLTKLTTLELGTNQITDISPLAHMTRLKDLNLNFNQIIDISPLAAISKQADVQLQDQFSFGQDTKLNVPVPNPLRSLDNSFVKVTEGERCVDGSCAELKFAEADPYTRTHWNLDLAALGFTSDFTQPFTGTLIHKVDPEDPPVVVDPTLQVEYAEVTNGGNQVAMGADFTPNESVEFTMEPGGLQLGAVDSNGDGNVLYSFTVPSETQAGTYRLVATQGTKVAEASFAVQVVVIPAPLDPRLQVSAASVKAGGKQTATATGFEPNQVVQFVMQPSGSRVGSAVADSTGRIAVTFTVPASTAAGTYSVVASQEKLSAKASFKVTADQVNPPACTPPRKVAVFADTPLSHKFYKEIDWMHCMGYSTGWRVPPGKPLYKPQDNLSREAMAAFIYRMQGPKGYTAPKVSPFADVKPGDPFYEEMAWMFEKGYATGWREASGKPTYRPKQKLTREAMAAFIYRLEAPKGYTAPRVSPMRDMKPGMPFYQEISWMYSEKLSTGNRVGSTKEYWPKDELSRQAMAAFIYRLVTDYRVKK